MGYLGSVWGILSLICVIWIIYDIFTYQKKMKDINKIIWIVAAIIFNILTAIVYYLVVKSKK